MNFSKCRKKKQFYSFRKQKFEKNFVSFPKNHTISTWIWILYVLLFLLRYVIPVFLKIFKFSFFCYEISSDYHFHSLTSSGKNRHHRRLLWASMTAKHQNIYLRSSFGHLEVFDNFKESYSVWTQKGPFQ